MAEQQGWLDGSIKNKSACFYSNSYTLMTVWQGSKACPSRSTAVNVKDTFVIVCVIYGTCSHDQKIHDGKPMALIIAS